jgi:hypothetical protein
MNFDETPFPETQEVHVRSRAVSVNDKFTVHRLQFLFEVQNGPEALEMRCMGRNKVS